MSKKTQNALETLFKEHGYEDYRWFDPEQVVVAQWVRMKCMFGGCVLCRDCKKERSLCEHPEMARPAPEAMAVDVFSTVKKMGYPISVRTDYTQAMNRYVFLMVY